MTTLTTTGILGSDGITPVYNPNNLWKTWNLTEIYTGAQGANRYVPNINDYVQNVTNGELFVVSTINPATMVAVLVPATTTPTTGVDPNDTLIGPTVETYRCYIDSSVVPAVVAVDARLHVKGSMVTSCKIFLGYDTSSTGTVISSFYDQSGHLLSQSVPLELVAEEGINNISIKTVPVCYTTQTVADGQPITVVFYSANGNVVSQAQLLAENTAFIRTTSSSLKYITSIAIESPFLSPSDPTVIQYPMNVPLAGLNLIGVVNYSDGSSIRLPVDGTKFTIFGFKNYVATIVGQKAPLVLKYQLSPGEIVYGATSTNAGQNNFISLSLSAVTENEDGNYTVKLYPYPVWNSTTIQYTLEWFMYTLERNIVYNVTPYVSFSSNSQPFNPTLYGVTQNLTVSINLNKVNPSYNSWNFVQTIAINLMQAGNNTSGTNWTIGYNPGQNPAFGLNNAAITTEVSSGLTLVNVSNGIDTLTDWLAAMYSLTEPLVDPVSETVAPTPNMFSILYNGQEFQYTIDQWSTTQQVGVAIQPFDTILLKFFLRTGSDDIQLAMAGMPVRQSN